MNIKNEVQTNWYAFYTMPRTEKKVLQRLEEKNENVFLPLIHTIRKWSDRKKKIYTPLLPSIIFVKTNEENIKNILQTQGIVCVIKYLKKPAIIKEHEINNLKILMNDPLALVLHDEIKIEEGEKVQVVRGSFVGLLATCIRHQGKHRIVVEIESLGKTIEINIPISLIEKIDHKAA